MSILTNMEIIFVDNRASIVQKVRELGIQALFSDYFEEAEKIPNTVLCTASNPMFTFGGGIDYGFMQKFPELCKEKRRIGGDNERIGNICFVISVDNRLDSNKELVRKALHFAIDNTKENETLLISGIGTSIGALNEIVFVDILKDVLKSNGII